MIITELTFGVQDPSAGPASRVGPARTLRRRLDTNAAPAYTMKPPATEILFLNYRSRRMGYQWVMARDF
jgi:hypothetical protein